MNEFLVLSAAVVTDLLLPHDREMMWSADAPRHCTLIGLTAARKLAERAFRRGISASARVSESSLIDRTLCRTAYPVWAVKRSELFVNVSSEPPARSPDGCVEYVEYFPGCDHKSAFVVHRQAHRFGKEEDRPPHDPTAQKAAEYNPLAQRAAEYNPLAQRAAEYNPLALAQLRDALLLTTTTTQNDLELATWVNGVGLVPLSEVEMVLPFPGVDSVCCAVESEYALAVRRAREWFQELVYGAAHANARPRRPLLPLPVVVHEEAAEEEVQEQDLQEDPPPPPVMVLDPTMELALELFAQAAAPVVQRCLASYSTFSASAFEALMTAISQRSFGVCKEANAVMMDDAMPRITSVVDSTLAGVCEERPFVTIFRQALTMP